MAYIDGFAGPGVYDDGSPGSPIIALDTLVSHDAFPNLSRTEFVFIFIEQDRKRVAKLGNQVQALWAARGGGQPKNVRVHIVPGRFEDSANEILKDLGDKALAPTVAFVDPFGFSEVALETLCRLTAYPRCEVLFSFMFDSVNRFIEHPQESIQGHLLELFGTKRFKRAALLPNPSDRRAFLHDLYKRQLADRGRFSHVLDFEMVNSSGHNVYSLVYATRHIKGLSVMKDAMWLADPTGQYRFLDRFTGQTTLFGEEPDFGPLREAILSEFVGRAVPIAQIEEFVLAETIFKSTHYKKQVLKPLQQEGLIESVENQGSMGTFPDRVVVHFAP